MNQSIINRLDLFTNNSETIRKEFKWHSAGVRRLAALIYALEDRSIDNQSISASLDVIKQNTRMFSMFRGNMNFVIATKLSLTESHEQLFANILDVANQLTEAKFRKSDYLAVSAYLIVTETTSENYDNTITRAKAFYDGMKKESWFRTGQDDYIFSIMLGLSDIDPTEGVARIQELYQQLQPEFKRAGGNSVQALCQMLTLGGKSDEALEHLLCLRNTLQSNKIKLDRTYTLPSLGALSLLPIDGEVLANQLWEAQGHLRSQKGFGSLSISTQELLLFASAIISVIHTEEMQKDVVALTSTSMINMIIAQQVALLIAVFMTTSSAATATSSG